MKGEEKYYVRSSYVGVDHVWGNGEPIYEYYITMHIDCIETVVHEEDGSPDCKVGNISEEQDAIVFEGSFEDCQRYMKEMKKTHENRK